MTWFALSTAAMIAALACGGGGAHAPVNATPSPIVTASVAQPHAEVSSIDTRPSPPATPAPLLALPDHSLCTWKADTKGTRAVRGRPDGPELAWAFETDVPIRASLVDAHTMFIEVTGRRGVVRGYTDVELQAARDILFSDALTLPLGGPVVIATDASGVITVDPPLMAGVTFTPAMRPARLTCSDLRPPTIANHYPPHVIELAQIGTQPVQLFAQPNGALIGTSQDAYASVLEKRAGWAKLLFSDGADLVAWTRSSSVKRFVPYARGLGELDRWQMKIFVDRKAARDALGARADESGGPVDAPAQRGSIHCRAPVTIFFGATDAPVALATVDEVTFDLLDAVGPGGETRVGVRPESGIATPSYVKAYIRADEARSCTPEDN
jgi:hypothetical protein